MEQNLMTSNTWRFLLFSYLLLRSLLRVFNLTNFFQFFLCFFLMPLKTKDRVLIV